jgi:hypothetical protein
MRVNRARAVVARTLIFGLAVLNPINSILFEGDLTFVKFLAFRIDPERL